MKQTIPAKMKALRQQEQGGSLVCEEVDVPKPGKGEVLIKMAFSPMNPSDLSFLQGTYVNKPNYPVIPGIEGSGTVVASGGGLLANLRMGKRVTCSSSPERGGTWAEYMVTSTMKVIPIGKDISFEQGAMLIVNPMTVLAFMDIVKKGKHKAIINNAAASTLGSMLRKICASNGIQLINIVRREEHVKKLKNEGADFVLNSSAKNFEDELKKRAIALNADLCFDAVGGDQTARLLNALPRGGKVILYSNMSQEPMTIAPRSIIQSDKSIEGFYLGGWAAKRGILQSLSAAKKVQKLVKDELGSKIRKIYPVNEGQLALEDYLDRMSEGKILIDLSK